MLISVIIPTYNRNDFLANCLDNLNPSNQSLSIADYEVIVTDDSNENIAKEFIEKQYPWVKWVSGPKKGPASNRNNGAKFAKNDWLLFLDDDCLPDDDILLNYKKMAVRDSKIAVMEGLIYSDTDIKPLFTAPVNMTGGHLWSCNFAIKKAVFEKINGFDENYKYANLEDNDLNKRLIIAGVLIIFNKDAKVYHPPRPVASPQKLARNHESWLYYHNKFGNKKTMVDLLKTIILTRLRSIHHSPKSFASVKVLSNLFVEVAYTIAYSRKWKKLNSSIE